jgi:hypothetical protein
LIGIWLIQMLNMLGCGAKAPEKRVRRAAARNASQSFRVNQQFLVPQLLRQQDPFPGMKLSTRLGRKCDLIFSKKGINFTDS